MVEQAAAAVHNLAAQPQLAALVVVAVGQVIWVVEPADTVAVAAAVLVAAVAVLLVQAAVADQSIPEQVRPIPLHLIAPPTEVC